MAPTEQRATTLWSPAPKAVLFDIDGTLVDSNYLHVDAWARAFEKVGHPVESWRIHRSIGLDSDRLLDALLGDEVDEFGDRAKDLHSEFYRASTGRLRPLPGAVELLHALSDAGVRVVLATSAPKEELEILLGVLDSDDALHATTSSDDVGTAKPEPDIVNVALERAGVDVSEALFVGDAVWDIEAAARASLGAIGVRTGGISLGELMDAGALQVFDDAAAVLADFESRRADQ
ncbi:HAD family hydrolase [Agreia pratensis]|uniref:Haloacid dehalogenase superfamily, subfamily IA, variant 3 with third motif having DD or ED/haloacid dehalogenase superfamily, subfamily IA, variant 1 with third motif having Dx(3-4)D or Dx(3-4)E n=1 Tax=Agreia pratensis TaxID=150121 RepID=A0A1X7JIM4_9MICO|nr:HAD family hydrolase [Agreia pratensis]SMG27582.1 haloacid dehalogenase superfamily, subfamily IA, variant 3 with third motif having DD or ED/haloacid dehalogenase superfamily, subfamily IA, variant 1 with third motif having Dx(3-4)D or Dx(3-4)E [Agreia pratensis]